MTHDNKNIFDIQGKKKLQKDLIENSINFKADCLVLGHADSITNETFIITTILIWLFAVDL